MQKNSAPRQSSQSGGRGITRRKFLWLLGSMPVMGAGLAACAAPAAPQATPATQAPTAPQPTVAPAPTAAPAVRRAAVKWKWGVLTPKLETAFQTMALEKGYFSELGLDMEIPTLANDADATKALISGDLQITESTPTQPLAAIAKGAELKIIGAFNQGLTHALFVRKEINDIKELVGKNIGITSPGSLPHVITSALLEKKGMDTNKVTWVNVGGSATAIAALAAGKIDAAAAAFDLAAQVEKEGAGKLLVLFRDELPEYFKGTIHVSDKLIREEPELVGNFLIAYGKGIRYALEHKDETLALAEKITKQSRAELSQGYDFILNKKIVEPNALIDPAKLQFMQTLNVQFKLQTEVLPVEKVATWDFQKRMVAVIGEYKK